MKISVIAIVWVLYLSLSFTLILILKEGMIKMAIFRDLVLMAMKGSSAHLKWKIADDPRVY